MAEDLDRLIHRYLEGLLSEEEGRLLNERVKSDPRARRRLAEAAFDTAQLPDLLEAEGAIGSEAPPAPARRWGWSGPGPSIAAAAVILAAVGIGFFFWPSPERPGPGPTPSSSGVKKGGEPPPGDRSVRKIQAGEGRGDSEKEQKRPTRPKNPERAVKDDPRAARFQGVRATVKGVVEGKGDNRIALRVRAVLPSANERAQGLVGERVDLGAGYLQNNDGEEGADPVHLAFLRKVQKGQEIHVDLRHDRAGSFVIASLTEEQVDWAGRAEEREDWKPEKKREERGGDRGKDRGGEDR